MGTQRESPNLNFAKEAQRQIVQNLNILLGKHNGKNVKSLIKIGANIPAAVVNIRDNLDDDNNKVQFNATGKKIINPIIQKKVLERNHFL